MTIISDIIKWYGVKYEWTASVNSCSEVYIKEVRCCCGEEIPILEVHDDLLTAIERTAKEHDDAPSRCSDAEEYGVNKNWFI